MSKKESDKQIYRTLVLFFGIVGLLAIVPKFGPLPTILVWGTVFAIVQWGKRTKGDWLTSLHNVLHTIARFLGVIVGAIILLVFLFSNLTSNDFEDEEVLVEEAFEESTVTIDGVDSLIIHKRKWKDFHRNEYKDSIQINFRDYENSVQRHKDMVIQGRNYYWQRVYKQLQINDEGKLDRVYAMLEDIRAEQQLNRKEFAEMIFTLIQDIDYKLILPTPCEVSANSDDFVKRYLKENPGKCQGNVSYGVNSPVEFLATLAGDCDTRTVLAHMILKHYNYDVIIYSSNHYAHSMLGIALPYTGEYKSYRGTRYYFLELTGKNWKPGVLPPDNRDKSYWYIEM